MLLQGWTMKIFDTYRGAIILSLLFLAVVVHSCNQISEGLQRRKFEFLYKLNNYAALYREYTVGVIRFNDLDLFDRRGKDLYDDVNKFQTVDGWGRSRVLKENFLSMIDSNLQTSERLRRKGLNDTEDIRKQYDVIIMNERTEKFLDEIYSEISLVGKEK